jgi:hypothetical protein
MSRARNASWCLALAALGCAHGSAELPAPARATGGLVRAIFATEASRARLQWQNAAQGGPACRASLRRDGVAFSPLPDRAAPGADRCGIPHGVTIARGPTGAVYQPPLTITCSLARLLPELERVLQDEARAQLATRVVRVQTFGSYSCREMRGWRSTMSEHAFGNAIDIAAFATADGRTITVERDFRRAGPAGGFLHRLQDRLRAETLLSYVLGPDHDAAHHNHFHVDRGVRWTAF